MTESLQNKIEIRNLIDDWAVWRDSGDWDRLRTTWHAGGMMQTTWFYGTGEDFVKGSQAAWERGVEVLHTLHGTSILLRGLRAVAQTKMAIHQRSMLQGILCDCVCMGRFYDFLERRDGRWGLILRHPIYEMDRLDPVDPSQRVELDQQELERFPTGYSHLAVLQSEMGIKVRTDLPGTRGEAVEVLYARGNQWLAGSATP